MDVQLVKIFDRNDKELRNKKVHLVRVLWKNTQMGEKTWERESKIKKKYPNLFSDIGKKTNFTDKTFIARGECKPLENLEGDT
jgi:hypothetical protein